jgi:RNA polymerase sigma factor (sigma-70 family)
MNPALVPANHPLLSLPLDADQAVGTATTPKPETSRVAELTRRLARGDDAAYREFHADYFDPLYRFLLVVTRGQEDEAKEALQQTLLRVVRYVRVFESEEVLWSWLKALARSAARDAGRKQRRYSCLLERFALRFGTAPQCPAPSEEHRLSDALEASLDGLDPEDRRLIEAKYLDGSTTKELCALNGGTEKAIESRLRRLRHQLRDRVLKQLGA